MPASLHAAPFRYASRGQFGESVEAGIPGSRMCRLVAEACVTRPRPHRHAHVSPRFCGDSRRVWLSVSGCLQTLSAVPSDL